MSSDTPTSPRRVPVTDSPWFWVMLFSAGGVVALMLIMPRYQPRQQRLEMQYRAREEILRRQAAGEPAARETGQEGEAPPPTTSELIIPLWPLLLGCVLLMMVAAFNLWRARQTAVVPIENTRGGMS